jgi:hypothetical protein
VELRIPFDIPKSLQESVRYPENGEAWQARFHDVWLHKRTTLKAMPEELGPTAPNIDPYARHSLWQLYAALAYGSEKVRFLAFWNGRDGDGPGGTAHMMKVVQQHAGLVYHLNTTKLW